MNDILSPWMNLPLPSDMLDQSIIDGYRDSENLSDYSRAILITRLRERANYTKLLPDIDNEQLSDTDRSNLEKNVKVDTTNPEYYSQTGSAAMSSTLFTGIQTFEVENISEEQLPIIRYRVSSLSGNYDLLKLIPDEADKISLAYWASKNKLFDTESFQFYNQFKDTIEQEERKLHQITVRGQSRSLEQSKIGMFGEYPNFTDPDVENRLSTTALSTEVRSKYIHDNVADYIKEVEDKDFINFAFEVVTINDEDFLEVRWRFPQAERVSFIEPDENFSTEELVSMYTKR